jgi:hypothetical protein
MGFISYILIEKIFFKIFSILVNLALIEHNLGGSADLEP